MILGSLLNTSGGSIDHGVGSDSILRTVVRSNTMLQNRLVW